VRISKCKNAFVTKRLKKSYKKIGLSQMFAFKNLAKCLPLKRFLIVSFLNALMLHFETSVNFSIFFTPVMTYLKEKHFHFLEGEFPKFFWHKNRFSQKITEY
jgi:hypothetical protein